MFIPCPGILPHHPEVLKPIAVEFKPSARHDTETNAMIDVDESADRLENPESERVARTEAVKCTASFCPAIRVFASHLRLQETLEPGVLFTGGPCSVNRGVCPDRHVERTRCPEPVRSECPRKPRLADRKRPLLVRHSYDSRTIRPQSTINAGGTDFPSPSRRR